MRLLITVFLSVAMASSLAAPGPSKSTILSSGLCEESGATTTYVQPQSAAGYASLEETLVITKKTDMVPLRKGIGFGFSWRAEGMPPVAKVVYVVEHPQITKPDGSKLTSFEEPMEHETQNGVLQTTDCYMLSEDHELVKGDWSLAIRYNGVQLVKKTFHIISEK